MVVTGATGFVGTSIVHALLANGRRVVAVVEPGADARNLDGLNVDRVTADILDTRALGAVLSGAKCLYHCAAIYRIWAPDPEPLYRVNLEGTVGLLLACQRQRVPRIVYTSTIGAVGLREDGLLSDESVAFNLHDIANDYIRSKHLAERVALQFAYDGLPLVVVNPAFPFGAGDRAPTPTGTMLLNIAQRRAPGYVSGGFNAIDVDLVAQGHLLAEEKGRVGERYILGDHNISFRDFNKLVAELAGVKIPDMRIPDALSTAVSWAYERVADHVTRSAPPITVRSAKYVQRNAFFDVSKARRELGLGTRPLRETIARALQWFREEGLLEPDASKARLPQHEASA